MSPAAITTRESGCRLYWNGIDYIGTLEIYGGSITAVGSQEGSGIGGGAGERVGNILIHGGFINAIGHYGAGIGGGMIKSGGITVINGGIVNAVTSNEGGAGIGGGRSSAEHGGDGGFIQILGGLVTAVGGNNGAGIGGGQAQDSGTIEIGGNAIVIARGNGGGAGIGGGLGNSDDGTQGGRVGSVSIFGNSIVFAGSGGDGYSQDIGMGNRGAPEDTIDRVSVLQNAAVLLRHNTLYAYTSAYSGPVLIPPRSYTEMSKFGLELTSLYPPERGRITGYEEHGENWLSDLWDGKIINWWNSAGNVGAFLVLKTLTYTNSQVSGSVPVQVRQHIGTKTTLLNGGELFETPTGYKFGNWVSNEPATYGAGESYTFASDFTLDASWELVTYTIEYVLGEGATVETPNPTFYTYLTPDFELGEPEKTGYTFDGWSGTGIDGTSKDVRIEQYSTGNRLYTANWTPNNYTICYHANNGTQDKREETHTYDTASDLRLNEFEYSGYSFAGWATSPDGDVEYLNGANVKNLAESGVFDLYAKWTAVEYSISYHNLADGEVYPENRTSYTVETPEFTLVNPTREDYTFAGWSGTGIDGMSTEVTIPAGSTGNREYTANWTAVGYTINYNLSSGEVSTPNLGEYTVETPGFTLVNPTREGYTFAGWSGTGIDGMSTEVTIPAGSTGNREYTANWTATVYSITYDLDGGEVSSENPADYTVETPEFTLVNPTKTGHNFAGWTEEGVEGDPVMTVTIPQGSAGNRTYIAHWTATVITGLPSSFEMHIGERVTWNPKPDGGTWDWDSSFFSASFNSPATFTALKPGTSAITYTVNGVVQKVTVTIRQEVSPDTNQDGDTRMWALALLAAACGAGAVLIWKRKRVKFQNKKA
jgi:uncharacterized repeat protein (TIGR02543 family)